MLETWQAEFWPLFERMQRSIARGDARPMLYWDWRRWLRMLCTTRRGDPSRWAPLLGDPLHRWAIARRAVAAGVAPKSVEGMEWLDNIERMRMWMAETTTVAPDEAVWPPRDRCACGADTDGECTMCGEAVIPF